VKFAAVLLAVALAVVVIGRQHVATQGCFACYEKSSAYVKTYSHDGGILIYLPLSQPALSKKIVPCYPSLSSRRSALDTIVKQF
jgi:hypothetical protein